MKLKVKKAKVVSYQRQLQGQMADAYDATLYRAAIRVVAVAVPRTPIVSGTLRRSGYVGPPQRHRVQFGFGVAYAWRQHETNPTHSKFLEGPVNEARSNWERDFAEDLQYVLDNGLKWGGGSFPQTPETP